MGYLIYNDLNSNKSFAINKDKIICVELDRAHKSLKVVYGLIGDAQQCTVNADLDELERVFNELTYNDHDKTDKKVD